MTSRPVIVLGGGIAGLSAAVELTDPANCHTRTATSKCYGPDRHPDCSLPSSVTVYEKTTELGGKGASVRNEARDFRIEEHGLHIWFGYYENAFRLLARCHRELDMRESNNGERRWSMELTNVADGFHPSSTVGLAEDDLFGSWSRWWTTFPEDEALPWNREQDTVGWATFDLRSYVPDIGARTTALLHAALRSLLTGEDPGELEEIIDAADLTLSTLDPLLDRFFAAAIQWSATLRRMSAQTPMPVLVSTALASLRVTDQLIDYIRASQDRSIAGNAAARRLLTIVDLLVGVTRGLLVDGVADDADIDRLDRWEWCDWLASHGVLGVSRDSALVRALSYCLPFAYDLGSRDLPAFSAAVGIRLFLRLFFTYRGALMWKMNYGMGEVVFAPIYELLIKRGVTFRFEHELSGIHTRSGSVVSISLRAPRTALAPAPDPYWPMKCDPRTTLCYWPLRTQRVRDAEWRVDTSNCDVILALPLPAIEEAAPDFVQSSQRWHEAICGRVEPDGQRSPGIASVATEAAQLWLTKPARALGWPAGVTASGFSEPFDTFSDMTHLLRSERTPSQGPSPRGLVYLCSVVEEDPSPSTVCCGEHTQPSAAGQARNVTPRRVDPAEDVALFLLDRAVYLWPGAIASAQTSAADQKAPQSLDDSLVIGIAPGADTIEKVVKSIRTPHARSPYVRLNSAPSDRYILSLPGSAALRIHPGNTGYDNLFAAGDWTACILNAGCIEAAAISGMLAAESLLRTQLAIIGREERPHGRT